MYIELLCRGLRSVLVPLEVGLVLPCHHGCCLMAVDSVPLELATHLEPALPGVVSHHGQPSIYLPWFPPSGQDDPCHLSKQGNLDWKPMENQFCGAWMPRAGRNTKIRSGAERGARVQGTAPPTEPASSGCTGYTHFSSCLEPPALGTSLSPLLFETFL